MKKENNKNNKNQKNKNKKKSKKKKKKKKKNRKTQEDEANTKFARSRGRPIRICVGSITYICGNVCRKTEAARLNPTGENFQV